MRIAIFTDAFLPYISGVVTATLNLAKGLADRGHEVHIIAPKYGKSEKFIYPNIIVKRIPSIPVPMYKDFRLAILPNPGLVRYIIENRIDLMHFQTPSPLGNEAVHISKLLKKPLVGTFHTFFEDQDIIKILGLNKNHLFDKLSWAYLRSYYDKCDLITCPSESTKKSLLAHRFKQPIKVISNGFDCRIFDNRNYKKIKKKYNPNGKLLLFVGRIAYEKNIDFLIDSFSIVKNELPGTKLLIVGSGPQMKHVKKKISSLKMAKDVILAGSIPHDKLVKSSIYKACDLFVTASKTENQPMTILEAQANGMACVGLKKRGIPDLVKDGFNGIVVPVENRKKFAEAIIRVLKNKALLNRMRKNTLLEARKHKLPHVIDEWEQTYIELIGKRKAKS